MRRVTYGERFRALRREAGLRQTDVAHALGCDQPRISDIERGRLPVHALSPGEMEALRSTYGHDVIDDRLFALGAASFADAYEWGWELYRLAYGHDPQGALGSDSNKGGDDDGD